MTYSVTLQWLCDHAAIARVHEGPGATYGDPYVWCATIRREGYTASIHGVIGPIPQRAARPFLDALRAAGIKYRVHDRIRDGKARAVVKPL